MMKNLHKWICGCFLTGSILCTFSACEEEDKIAVPHPSVDKWEISSATVGDELSVTGENIHLISAVKFGEEVIVDIDPAKRNRTALTFQVPALPMTDTLLVVAVYNTSKTLVLSEAFEVIVPPVIPVVSGGLPATAKPGDVITLTGENLEIIKTISLGEETVEIRIKNETTLSFVVPEMEFSATLPLRLIYDNILGTDQVLVVAEEWPVTVPVIVPEVTQGVPASVSIGEEIVLTGTNLQIIKAVYFNNSEIEIVSKEATKLVFKAPLLETTTTGALRLAYDNALGRDQELLLTEQLEVVVAVPVVSDCPETGDTGKAIRITGTDLQLVEKVLLGDMQLAITTQNATILEVELPSLEIDTTLDLKAVYRTDKTLMVKKDFKVAASAVYSWLGVVIGGQATGLSLFNASTGEIVTPCDLFEHQTEVDFMMNVTTDGTNNISGPHNTTKTLKNQKCDGKKLGESLDNGGDGKDYTGFFGVTTKFRLLTETGAQGEVVQLVKEGKIRNLSDEFFTGISEPSSSAPKNFEAGQVYWFKNAFKGKNGLFLVTAVTPGATPQENTLTLEVYYEK